MNINNAFPSKWLKSGDIEDGADLILTISSVEIQTVGQGEDSEEKPVLSFTDSDKGLVLNKTNASTISTLYGPETDGWTGKKIAIYSTEVPFGSKMTIALRVRTKAPAVVSKLWQRWHTLGKEAAEFGVPVPNLDPAASDEDVTKAGKALASLINEARNKAAAF